MRVQVIRSLLTTPICPFSGTSKSPNTKFSAITRHHGSHYWNDEDVSPRYLHSLPLCYYVQFDFSEHLWLPTPATAATCYLSERLCKRTGDKRTCIACHVAVHSGCVATLLKVMRRRILSLKCVYKTRPASCASPATLSSIKANGRQNRATTT